MREEQRYLGLYLGRILDGKTTDDIVLPEHISNNDVLRAAADCSTLSVVYPSICENGRETDDYYFRLQAKLLSRSLRQIAAQQDIMDEAESRGIDLILLKGSWTRDMYKDPLLRSMGDLDIYYDFDDEKKIKDMLLSFGYEKEGRHSHHTVWNNYETAVSVEMHHTIEQPEFFENPFYEKAVKNREKYRDYEHIFHLSLCDGYVYQLLHLYHHTKCGSVSMRQLCDLYLYEKNGADTESLKGALENLDVYEFALSVHRIIRYLFFGEKIDLSSDEISYLEMWINKSDKSKLERFMDNIMKEEGTANKYLVHRLFPKRKSMYVYYVNLNNHRYLLPFYYVYHAFNVVYKRQGKSVELLKKEGYSGIFLKLIPKKR